MSYPRIAQLRTVEDFLRHTHSLGIEIPISDTMMTGESAPLAQPIKIDKYVAGNRFTILPMEGWDGTTDGRPTEFTQRRWHNFGLSGAKLIWGEATAVRADGRANPNQLAITEANIADFADLHDSMREIHRQTFGTDDDLVVGLQLTHSGRYCRPNTKTTLEPRIAYRHPLLDRKVGIQDDQALFTDDDLDELIDAFVRAAQLARQAGFQFVDIKHCHGYLLHELLSAYDRPGKYGGSFENRTRFLRTVVTRIREEIPDLMISVRISAFDWIPFEKNAEDIGVPSSLGDGSSYRYAFGGDPTGTGIDLTEPKQFLDLLLDLGISLTCITAGSPYYVPHIQRPALFPPSDGYLPPEDPLVGVWRQLKITAELKAYRPELVYVGSGYSYLQEWLPNVAQQVVSENWADMIGLGRMTLSYPKLPSDVLSGITLDRKRICRTFSDCTTAPRKGLISGCFPLDPFYKSLPEADLLKQAKQSQKKT